MLQYSSLCFVFIASSSVIADVAVVDLTPADYADFLDRPPHRSFSGFLKPDFVTPDIDHELQEIAAQFHLKLSDVYQWLVIMQSENVALDESMDMIRQLASQVYYEKTNMFGLPYPMYMQYFVPQMPKVPGMMHLQRREPEQEGLVEAIVDDTAMNAKKAYNGVKDGLDKAYDNVMKFADKVAPQTTESLKNVVNSLVGSGSSPTLSDKLKSNLRYMMADN